MNFCKCVSCSKIFQINKSRIDGFEELLCESCKDLMEISHIVQCNCCQSIVDLIPVDPNESQDILFVENCSFCKLQKSDMHLKDDFLLYGNRF